MKKWFKWLIVTVIGLLVIIAVAIAIFVATFNPNSYKSKLESYVLDNYARVLSINGDIGLSLFPNLALQISDVSLSEASSTDSFAAIKDARLSVAVMPLLSKHVEINHIAINGLDAKIIKNANGGFNFDDLIGVSDAGAIADGSVTSKSDGVSTNKPKAAAKSDLNIAVAGVDIENSQLDYLDKKTGQTLKIYNIKAKTGAVSIDRPFDVDLSALVNSNQPELALQTDLSAKFTLADNYQTISVQNLDLKATGDFADLKQLKFNLASNLDIKNSNISANDIQMVLLADLAGEKPLSGINLKLTNGQVKLQAKTDHMLGNLAIDKATYKDQIRDVEVNDIAATLDKGPNGTAINDLHANLYEGKLLGQVGLSNKQQLAVKLDLQEISLQALLKSLSAKDLLAGRGFVQLDLKANGADLDSIEKSLNGKLAMQIKQGVLLGVDAKQTLVDLSDLIGSLSNIKQLRLDKVSSPLKKGGETAFSKFDLLMNIKNGQAVVNNLLVKSDVFDVTQGDPAKINVPDKNLDLVLNVKIADDLPKSSKLENILGITIPVHVKGAWVDPQYSVKLDGLLVEQAVKNVLETGIQKLLGKDKKSDTKSGSSEKNDIGKTLKGLFGG